MRNSYSRRRRFFKPTITIPLILILSIFVDGAIMGGLTEMLTPLSMSIIPNITLVVIFYLVRFQLDSEFPFMIWVAITGFIFDIYYTFNIGTYLFSFLIAAYMMNYIEDRLRFQKRIVTAPITFTVGFVFFYLFVIFGGILTGNINQSVTFYLVHTLLPTYAFNLGIALIFYKMSSWLSYKIAP